MVKTRDKVPGIALVTSMRSTRAEPFPWLHTKEKPAEPLTGRHQRVYEGAQGQILVTAMTVRKTASHVEEWKELISRSVEPNIFLDPDFLLPALQHLAMSKVPDVVMVWDISKQGQPRKLIGLVPMILPRIASSSFARLWNHDQSALATPLIDREQGPFVLESLLNWLQFEYPLTAGMISVRLRHDGQLMILIRQQAALGRLQLNILDQFSRAALYNDNDVPPLDEIRFSAKKQRQLRRLRRRLEELGQLRFVSAEGPQQVKAAVEKYLVLEGSGWKGRRGTAMLNDPGRTTFLRVMTRLMVREHKCRIDWLELNGAPIAMIVILKEGGQAYLWKIAYDESFAVFSPGVQLMMEVTRRQKAESDVTMTDACTITAHPLMDALWSGRIEIADVAIGPSTRRFGFNLRVAAETAKRNLRQMLKESVNRTLKRKQN